MSILNIHEICVCYLCQVSLQTIPYIMSTLTFVYLQALLHEFSAQQQKMREKQKMLKVHTSSTFGI